MPRFFMAGGNIFGGIAHISGRDAEHIKVLRLRRGEVFSVCDGKGTDYTCRLLDTDGQSLEAEIMKTTPSLGEPNVDCTVYTAYPKGDKAESIIQKSVELGASKIIFFPSARCVSRPEGAVLMKKCDRWQRISEEAAKQSGRGIIPEVGVLTVFENAVAEASRAEMPLFFYEAETDYTIKQALESTSLYKTVSVMTGPEGGFEASEVLRAKERGMLIASMGRRILRCETAPMCALAAVMFHTGNL